MSGVPPLAPRLTLNLVQGDTLALVLTARDTATSALLNLTGFKAAMRIRQAVGGTVILTLCTAAHPDFTTSTGCVITLGGPLGTITLSITDEATAALLHTQFTTTTDDNGVDHYAGVFDLELMDSGGAVQKYARGKVKFFREATA